MADDPLLRTALQAAQISAFEYDLFAPEPPRVVHPEDRGPLRDALAALTPERPDLQHEYRILLPDHSIRHVVDVARGEFAPDGTLVRLRGFTRDVTEQREAEARLMLLATVSEIISRTEDAAELLDVVARAIGEHLQLRRCLFTEIDLEHNLGIVRRDYCRGVPSVAGVYDINEYAEATLREMKAGRVVVNCDSKVDPRTASRYETTYASYGERSYIAVPLLRDGRWVAELWISDDVPRAWSEQDVALLVSVAERVWTAVEKLRVNAALRESEARLQFVAERAGIGYWYWDVVEDRLFWSPVCRRLFGVDLDAKITYAQFIVALHPDDRERVNGAVRAALSSTGSGEYDVEVRTNLRGGRVRWIQSKGSATFENGVAVRMAGIALDITQRKTLEREREEASLAKDHFLALLSHELRTPMTTIMGWASFLAGGVSDPSTIRKGIESIEQASRAQSRLIDDLLDVSRIVTGKLTLQAEIFDLADAVRAALQVVEPVARANDISVAADLGAGPAFVSGDATRMQQVAWNLLTNAVKFTPRGGSVHVSVRELDEAVELSVRDNGVGIERAFLPHVFERFRQADDSPSRRFGGLGLGLSIVRNLVELHGGTVEAFSDGANLGAEFLVRLPRVVPAQLASRPAAGVTVPHDALAGVRVLLVDDDEGTREMIAAILTAHGARVTIAASAVDALRLITQAAPDLIVSDIGMPDQDGHQLIRHVRASAVMTPAIALTAYADLRDRELALASGYQAHIAKPVDAQALVAAVQRVLSV